MAKAGEKAVFFVDEEGDLSHAAGVDNEEERGPC